MVHLQKFHDQYSRDGLLVLAKWMERSVSTVAAPTTALMLLSVGFVFLSEGIQKFLFPHALGVGRFMKIGIPAPEILAPFARICEVVCGLLVLPGLPHTLGRHSGHRGHPVAITATKKIPILLKSGLWAIAHEARTDFSMLLGSLFLVTVGAGPWSVDKRLTRGGDREHV
jgi:putative oxidoreductase